VLLIGRTSGLASKYVFVRASEVSEAFEEEDGRDNQQASIRQRSYD